MDFKNYNNNKPINYINFNSKDNMQEQQKTDADEILEYAVKFCSQKIMESAKNYVPESNKFSPYMIAFKIPETNNVAKIIIKHDEENYKTQRRIFIGVHHENSDMLISNCVFKGTKNEVLEYLKSLSDENLDKTVENIKKLSKSSDEQHSSL